MLDRPNWPSLRDLANPRRGARALTEMYGDAAAAAAASCAAAARADGRDDDYRYWIDVRARLEEMARNLAKAETALREDAGDRSEGRA